MKRRILSMVTIIIVLISLFGVTAYAQQQIRVSVDGNILVFPDQQPVMQNNRVLVPARAVAEALNFTVTWDGENQSVKITKDGKLIYLKINSTDVKITNDGVETTTQLDVPAAIINDRTMVPVRFVATALGCGVNWDGPNQMVLIATDGTIPEPTAPTTPVLPEGTAPEIVELSKNPEIAEHSVFTANELFYHVDSTIKYGRGDFYLTCTDSSDEPNYFVIINLKNDAGELNAIKEILKLYYPTKYETVYSKIFQLLKSETQVFDATYDGRTFKFIFQGDCSCYMLIGKK